MNVGYHMLSEETWKNKQILEVLGLPRLNSSDFPGKCQIVAGSFKSNVLDSSESNRVPKTCKKFPTEFTL